MNHTRNFLGGIIFVCGEKGLEELKQEDYSEEIIEIAEEHVKKYSSYPNKCVTLFAGGGVLRVMGFRREFVEYYRELADKIQRREVDFSFYPVFVSGLYYLTQNVKEIKNILFGLAYLSLAVYKMLYGKSSSSFVVTPFGIVKNTTHKTKIN